MSKERARRRAEREAQAARERGRKAKEAARRAKRRAVKNAVARPLRSAGEPGSALARERRRQNGVLIAVLISVNAVVWLLWESWLVRGSVLTLSLFAWPLLLVVFFDRRSTR